MKIYKCLPGNSYPMSQNALGKADDGTDTGQLKILHVFADVGAENPTLARFGDVYRFSVDAQPNAYSHAIKADAYSLPVKPDTTFDLGVFHPVCGGASPMADTHGNSRDDWDNQIPQARELAHQYTDNWIIENKPRDEMQPDVVLDGHMFNLGVEYERVFETSFPVEQPPQQTRLAETSPFFYTEWTRGEWAAVKQTDPDIAPKQHIAKDTIPGVYLTYLMRYYFKHVDDVQRPDYSNYDRDMDAQRAKEANADLAQFQ